MNILRTEGVEGSGDSFKGIVAPQQRHASARRMKIDSVLMPMVVNSARSGAAMNAFPHLYYYRQENVPFDDKS
jgi:hypothetical protein